MRTIALLAAAALLAPAIASAAPKVDSYYSKTYNDCMEAAGGSTLPMRDCLGAEYQAWDKQLNAVYQTLIAGDAAPDKVKLRDDERAWLKRTKHKCDHAGDDERGGTLQGVEIDQCNLDETILRTVYLRALR